MATGNPLYDETTNNINYEAVRSSVANQAAKVRQVEGATMPSSILDAMKMYTTGEQGEAPQYETKKPYSTKMISKDTPATHTAQTQAAMQSAMAQRDTLIKQADAAGTGLELRGSAYETAMRRLDAISASAEADKIKITDGADEAAKKAEEYVKDNRARIDFNLDRLKAIKDEIDQGRDFAKTHGLLAAAQAVRGSIDSTLRELSRTLPKGAQDPAYQVEAARMNVKLAEVQSQIHSTFQQLKEQTGQAYLAATNEQMWKSDMYESFQEQQHVEMLKYANSMQAQYNMQYSDFQTSVARLKLSSSNELATYMEETPYFTMDWSPLASLIADVTDDIRAREAEYMAGLGPALVGPGHNSPNSSGYSWG